MLEERDRFKQCCRKDVFVLAWLVSNIGIVASRTLKQGIEMREKFSAGVFFYFTATTLREVLFHFPSGGLWNWKCLFYARN